MFDPMYGIIRREGRTMIIRHRSMNTEMLYSVRKFDDVLDEVHEQYCTSLITALDIFAAYTRCIVSHLQNEEKK